VLRAVRRGGRLVDACFEVGAVKGGRKSAIEHDRGRLLSVQDDLGKVGTAQSKQLGEISITFVEMDDSKVE